MVAQTILNVRFLAGHLFSLRWLPLLILLCLTMISGCARKPLIFKPGPPPPEFDPVALQAKSLELAREVMSQRHKNLRRDYEIGSTDILEISVFEIPKYTTTARVAGDGTIRFPDLGVIKVSGMSERKVEDLIQRSLKEQELVVEPQVTVFVRELHAREVTVAGEVRTPGVYPIAGGESLMDVISKAGGLSATAGSYAYILRSASDDDLQTTSTDRTIKVDLVALLLRGEHQWNIPIMAGDRITVPTLGWVHITGLGIERAGTYQLRTTPNLLRQSIDDAGGLKFAADHKLLIVRRYPDGRQETYTVDYDKILEDENNDIMVQGSDTIIVNRTIMKTALSFIGTWTERIVRVGINLGGYIPLFGDDRYGGYGGGY